MDYDYRALIGKWHVSKQSMTQPLVSFFLLLAFFWSIFSIDLEIIAFFSSNFFSARLGIALEVGRQQKKKLIQNKEEPDIISTFQCCIGEKAFYKSKDFHYSSFFGTQKLICQLQHSYDPWVSFIVHLHSSWNCGTY